MFSAIDGTSKSWSKIAEKWVTYFKPPSRPSKEETEIYARLIKQNCSESQRALILGATPEILNVLSEANLQTDLIDINQEMVDAMLEIASQSEHERVITIGNWLDMPYEDNSFDVVLGDAVIQNVPYADRHNMIEQIWRVLRPGGIYLNRSFCVPEEKPYGSIDEILEAFREKSVDETTAIELVYEIQVLNYDHENHLAAMSDVRDVVAKLRVDEKFDRENEKENQLLNILWDYWLSEISDKVWVYDTRSNEEQGLYQPYFEIVESFEAKDHPYGRVTPLYLLKKI